VSGLPAWIGAALAAKLDRISRIELRERALAASEAYRAGGTSDVIRSDTDALAYALARMPATYAAVRACLTQTAHALPSFAPHSILDVGAGPGTASWAGIAAWPSVRHLHWIERNDPLLALARTLAAAPGAPQAELSVGRGDVAGVLADCDQADMVMASYALTELAPVAATAVLRHLWELTGRLLVLVEPGTADGFKRVLGYREVLLAQGATIVAPCSHHGACPLRDNPRWCHFGVRLPRSRDHLLLKDADVPYEDEKFSYLVAGKGFEPIARGGRILATPKVSKAGATLELCAPNQVERRVITRRDKDAYRAAKRCDWGDALT
jgi:ribosomal protein RSM22 (predicted rRNA methylase)